MTRLKYYLCIVAALCVLQLSIISHAFPIQDFYLTRRKGSLHGKFVAITDIHMDPYYLIGSDPETLCHRSSGNSSFDQVGTFGALGTLCDSPVSLVDAIFEFLKKYVQDIDFIIYTGDTVRHDRDPKLLRTREDILEEHKAAIKYFQIAYNTERTPLIPTIGNNDPFEHDVMKERDPIFSTLKKIWSPLNLNLQQEFNHGGYFVQDLIKGKLSVINLNSMYFYNEDPFVKDCNDTSSSGYTEMKWFENQLKSYKRRGHQVYVMSHIPPISDEGHLFYMETCHKEYLNLLGKYGSIISGHFTGHTNNDNLNAVIPSWSHRKPGYAYMAPDSEDAPKKSIALNQASMALFNAPSIIPANNPALRVYHYDIHGKKHPFGTIRNWKQYYVNLEKANKKSHVSFELEYTASDLYGVDHFDGSGVGQAILNVANNPDALALYNKYVTVSKSNSSFTTS